MSDIYAPFMRALVVGALVLATATLMFVAVNTARAGVRAGLIRSGHSVPIQVSPAAPQRPVLPSG